MGSKQSVILDDERKGRLIVLAANRTLSTGKTVRVSDLVREAVDMLIDAHSQVEPVVK